MPLSAAHKAELLALAKTITSRQFNKDSVHALDAYKHVSDENSYQSVQNALNAAVGACIPLMHSNVETTDPKTTLAPDEVTDAIIDWRALQKVRNTLEISNSTLGRARGLLIIRSPERNADTQETLRMFGGIAASFARFIDIVDGADDRLKLRKGGNGIAL